MQSTLRADLIRIANDHPEVRPVILPLLERRVTAARPARLKKDVRLRNGRVLSRGAAVTVEFDPAHPGVAVLKVSGQNEPIKVDTVHLSSYLDGYDIPPPKGEMRLFDAEGVMAPSVTGRPVDERGWADDGSPSWTLALKGRF